MRLPLFQRKRRLALFVVAVGSLALALTTGALAVFPDSDVTSYAGCLNTGGAAAGTFSQVKPGDIPAKSCGSNQMVIHLSGGDITAVRTAPGSGLTGGTENGAATLSLAGGQLLPQACAGGQVPKWNGSGWACGNDANTTYSGNDFALSNQSCTSGEFAAGVTTTGTLSCAAPVAPSPQAIYESSKQESDLDHGGEASAGELSIPQAGNYLVIAKGQVYNPQNDTYFRCNLRQGDATGNVVDLIEARTEGAGVEVDTVATVPWSLLGVMHFASAPGKVTITCVEFNHETDSYIFYTKITALRVGS